MIRFSIGREDLYKPLEQISGPAGIGPKGEVITSNVLFVVTKNNNDYIKDANYVLQMTCTDTEIEMITEVGLFSDDIEEGDVTVNVKKLLEIIKSLPEGSYITFKHDSKDERNLVLETSKNKFYLVTLPTSQYPNIDVLNTAYTLKIEGSKLLNLMKTTFFSMAQESYRFFLNGMRFSINHEEPSVLNIYTADGHRLSLQRGDLLEPCIIPEICNDKEGFIFPKKGVSEVIKLLSIEKESIVEFFISNNSLKTTINGITIISKLISAVYPNVLSVVPNKCTRFIVVNREDFKSTLQRVSILCNSKSQAIEIIVNNNVLMIKAKNNQHEEASEIVDMINYDGDDFELAYNVRYFIDVCNAINTKKIKISMAESSNNAMLEPLPEKDEEASFARYIISRVVI
ncbi:MAG: DNA polymerase III subunit beta [Succinivibrionaceae bacterium]